MNGVSLAISLLILFIMIKKVKFILVIGVIFKSEPADIHFSLFDDQSSLKI